jgi:predicted ATPase
MLTRLKVSGFKNLIDVDVRFGPFTCIAGANGVGKSNLFDAIHFLSALAERPFMEAALSVRDEGERTTDVRSLFFRAGNISFDQMSFEAEMIVPQEAIDDLGQKAKASITFLRYAITLAYRAGEGVRSLGSLELIKEELFHINIGDATKYLLFPHSVSWRKSAIQGRKTSPFISTGRNNEKNRVIELHQDGGPGRSLSLLAANLPRTVLSTTNAAESRTALIARREMQSWRLLQLEPSSLRKPDEFTAPIRLGADGSHIASTLYHLARSNQSDGTKPELRNEEATRIYGQIANRLAELIKDVRDVWIDRDERRELLTLHVTNQDGTPHPARALSDGTLRFLALAVLEIDPEAKGLLCLEEPENGIHPERIPAMLSLLQDIATDADIPIGPDNPLRQVIINTHSPAVVGQVPEDSLLIAELKEAFISERRFKRLSFSYLPGTWRDTKAPESERMPAVAMGKLLAYLNPVVRKDTEDRANGKGRTRKELHISRQETKRVVDRQDIKQLLLPLGEQE